MNIKAILSVIEQVFINLFNSEKQKVSEAALEYIESAKERAKVLLEGAATGELDTDFIKQKILSEKDILLIEGIAIAQMGERDIEQTLSNVASIIIGAIAATQKP
jgi:urease accessory protein UreE